MGVKNRKLWNLSAVVIVLTLGLGCVLTDLATLTPMPTPTATPAPPTVTPTPLPPIITPIPGAAIDEGVAVQGLQSRIISVYKAVSPSVVNITNRSYAYSIFGQVIPQEGSGSGRVYDTGGHIITNYYYCTMLYMAKSSCFY